MTLGTRTSLPTSRSIRGRPAGGSPKANLSPPTVRPRRFASRRIRLCSRRTWRSYLPALVSRLCRHAATLILAAALAAQALLAGLVAEGALVQTPGVSGFAVICHGSGASDQGNGTLPEPTGAKHPCCIFCTAAAPSLGGPPSTLRPQSARSVKAAIPEARTISITWRAVRAGLSQAAPSPI
jgi:hypothetical protein